MRKGENQRSWKGESEREVEPILHRWQMGADGASGEPLDAPFRRMRRWLAILLGLSVAMLSGFVVLLLHSPIKTPLITVGATKYVWPLPPNGWVQEDVDGLSALHGKSVHWRDSSKAWQTKSTCLDDLREKLRENAPLAKRAGALVLYINMHGAVNEAGDACLIPPEANILSTTQWVKVEEIVSTIMEHTPEDVRVLIALDCVHRQANWNIAQLENTFVQRLDEWAEKSCPQSVVLMTSCSADQRAWGGPDLRNSIFGRELRLGLAGEADRPSISSRPGGGNGDGSVSMRELVEYLERSVDSWAFAQRGRSQKPRVLPNRTEDFRVTWALKSGELARQIAAVQHTDLATPPVASTELEELWRSLGQLRDMAVYRFDPKGWADLEHKLLWLEQLTVAGNGYSNMATEQVFPSLKKRISKSLESAIKSIDSENEIGKWDIFRDGARSMEIPSNLPSIALREQLGEIPSIEANELRARIVNSAVHPEDTIPQITNSLGLPPQASQWNELNFLGIAKTYDCMSAWPDHSAIQKLFELRHRSELAAIRGDVRAHRWRRPSLLMLDQERRKAEDQLILGPENWLIAGSPEDPWSELGKALSRIDRTDGDTSPEMNSIFQSRDKWLAEITYLAQWICSPETNFDNLPRWNLSDSGNAATESVPVLPVGNQDVTQPSQREELAIQELLRLLDGLHRLSDLLSEVDDKGDGQREQVEELSKQLNADFLSLKALVQDHIERSSRSTAPRARAICEIETLLTLPFLSADERIALRKGLTQRLRQSLAGPTQGTQSTATQQSAAQQTASVASAIRNRITQGKPGVEPEKSSESGTLAKTTRYADRMRSWGEHPLGALLSLKNGMSLDSMAAQIDSKANDLERELAAVDLGNSKVRQCYQAMQQSGAVRIEDWCDLAGVDSAFKGRSEGWTRLAFFEHVERVLVPVCSVPFEANSSLSYLQLAFKDMLHWFAQRTLDDFYANPGENRESYFERSAAQVLNYATRIQVDTDRLAESTQAILARAQALSTMARNGIRTESRIGAPGSDTDPIRYEIGVRPSVSNTTDGSSWTLPIPEGNGTLLARNARGISKVTRIGVPLPIAAGPAIHEMVIKPADTDRPTEVVLVYRGHEYRSPLSAGQGIIVDFKPERRDWAELVLFGDTKRQTSIIFVLDCSWSMGEEIPVEAVAMNSQSRLELAKASLLEMITQLSARPDARIGVRLFGHRLGWSRPVDAKTGLATGKTEILVQPNYPETIPDDLVPSRDVEAILPLGRFSLDMVGGLANKLSKIVPWGQSPLYLAIIESFRDFDVDDESTAKSIVVITDGDNFQFNASGRPGGEPGETTSMDSVFRAWNDSKIPLFILGVGLSNADEPGARQNLIELAERTNGRYYDVENGSDLLRALSEQLILGTFRVSRLDSKRNNKSPVMLAEAKLNTPVELKPISGDPYEVAMQSISKTVSFQGGESLELFLSEDGQDIVSRPFDRSSPRAATLVREGSKERLIARVHRPVPHSGGVQFPVSVQDPDQHFTPRPKMLWIEVTPVSAKGDSPRQTYWFYDANYDPKTPVPQVTWNASNWPNTATAADVRIWAKYETTPSLQSIPLRQIKRNEAQYSEGITIDGLEGVSLGINIATNSPDSGRLTIQVTETHNERSKGVGSIRVDLENDDSIVPARVTRHFEPANHVAVHTFEFEGAGARAVMDSLSSRITIQTREAAHEGAWQLESGQAIRAEVKTIPSTVAPLSLPARSPSQ